MTLPRRPMRRTFARDRGAPEPSRIVLSDAERRALVEIDVAVLARNAREVQVRMIETGEDVTVRPSRTRASLPPHIVPGQVATLVLGFGLRRPGYAVGELRSFRVDAVALRLRKLRLHERGVLAVSANLPKARVTLEGPRSAHEMQQVLPSIKGGRDPILASIRRRERGELDRAAALLLGLVRRDFRCIDAHAHLGNLAFWVCAEHARLHYEVGAAIGDHALGPDFRGALPWLYENNRPFLRCLYGLGLSLWRLGRMRDAARVFGRMLWLNPADEQGAGRCLRHVRAGCPWETDGS